MSEKNDTPSYTTVSKVQQALLACKELEGRYSTETTQIKQSGSSEPATVLKFAVELTKLVKNKYTPAKADLMACAEKLLAETVTQPSDVPEQHDVHEEDSEEVPSAPVERSTASQSTQSVQQNQLVQKLARETGVPPEKVDHIVQSAFGEMSTAYLLGFIALANSLHYLASEHDKLPGHEARIKAIDEIREQYVQAGTLSIRKSRS